MILSLSMNRSQHVLLMYAGLLINETKRSSVSLNQRVLMKNEVEPVNIA